MVYEFCCLHGVRPDTYWCLTQDYMGRCILTLTKVIMVGEYKDELPLDDAKSGKLHLHLKWTPQPIYRDS